MLRGAFQLAAAVPRSRSRSTRAPSRRERLRHLAALGFNRISFGVQDFDPDVQQAVHRVQPFESVQRPGGRGARAALRVDQRRPDLRPAQADARVVRAARSRRWPSCGPTASRCTPMRTCRSASSRSGASHAGRPAHRRAARAHAGRRASPASSASGYVYIGMDHFALPDDALAVAKRQGRLHRNFQGYSTQPDCDLIGLGVSAIGHVGATYSQNAKTLPEYYDALAPGRAAGRARPGADARRPGAPRRDHGADVPGAGRVRVDRAGAPDQHARVLRRRARARSSRWPRWAWSRSSDQADPGHRHGLVSSCAAWPWSSTATCRPTRCASASRGSSERGRRADRQRRRCWAWPARRTARRCAARPAPRSRPRGGAGAASRPFISRACASYAAAGAVAAASVGALATLAQRSPALRPLVDRRARGWRWRSGLWLLLTGRQPAWMAALGAPRRRTAVRRRRLAARARPGAGGGGRRAVGGLALRAAAVGAAGGGAGRAAPPAGAAAMAAFAVASSPGLLLAPWVVARGVRRSATLAAARRWAIRAAGAMLAAASGWALTHGLWDRSGVLRRLLARPRTRRARGPAWRRVQAVRQSVDSGLA